MDGFMSAPLTLNDSVRSHIVHRGWLRVLDVLLAGGVLLLLIWPFLLFLRAGHHLKHPRLGLGGVVFQRREWAAGAGIGGRVGKLLGVAWVPHLWHVCKGDMSLVGPRPLSPHETQPPMSLRPLREAVRPGVFSLWGLRQRTNIAYGSEWDTDAEQLAHPGIRAYIGLLSRSLLAALYGRNMPANGTDAQGKLSPSPCLSDRVLIDTLRVHVHHTMATALDAIEAAWTGPSCTQVAFVNADCVNIARRNPRYRNAVNHSALVLPDGVGLRIAGQWLGQAFAQNLNGTDLFPRLCERLAQRQGRLFLLGARPGVAEAVGAWVQKHHPGVQVVGTQHGYFSPDALPEVLNRIQAAQADVLLVALGAPAQERWIAEHGAASGAKVAMGVGGLFDFYAQRIPRAPQWLRELGLEWAYRLWQEPGRMWRRYLIGNALFLLAVGLQRMLGSVEKVDTTGVSATAAALPVTPHGVLLALADGAESALVDTASLPALWPLGDRPLIVRSLETMAALGCRSVDVLADTNLAELADLLDDGTRWGMELRLHAVADREQALARLRVLTQVDDSPVLLALADHWLPATDLVSSTGEAIWVYPVEGGSLRWSGWACLVQDWLSTATALVLQSMSNSTEAATPMLELSAPLTGSQAPYRFDTSQEILASQMRWLARDSGVFDTLPERAPGIRIAPTATVAADAVLIAPVEIFAGAVVSSKAQVGPNVSVGKGALIGEEATVAHALVTRRTWIAPGADVTETLVLPHGIVSARWQAWLPASLIQGAAGSVDKDHSNLALHKPSLQERLLALLIAVLALPVALPVALVQPRARLLRHLLPGLPAVVIGKRPLVGVQGGWATHQAHQLPTIAASGWQDALSQAQPGLITPSLAFGSSLDSPEAQAWADVHWLVNRSWAERWRMLRAYARRAFLPQPA
jgi:N-acetylglucosaminyldiphosphoundecaprenol N-acetyl-beta-D-mannosaminyltransferase